MSISVVASQVVAEFGRRFTVTAAGPRRVVVTVPTSAADEWECLDLVVRRR